MDEIQTKEEVQHSLLIIHTYFTTSRCTYTHPDITSAHKILILRAGSRKEIKKGCTYRVQRSLVDTSSYSDRRIKEKKKY